MTAHSSDEGPCWRGHFRSETQKAGNVSSQAALHFISPHRYWRTLDECAWASGGAVAFWLLESGRKKKQRFLF
ncbi:hypothetical protein EVAR_47529_1 [Eumeta japonica]|uniref:Uncharacterized protein n=1 Tax=Eumeta variegata TaxID=151549 RepID=A0A4C1XUZ1_EUMVA|nr:hypothetical protein EVAR_47529_1 [Eumeta japonica]